MRAPHLSAQGVGELLHYLFLVKVLFRLPPRLVAVADALPQPLRAHAQYTSELQALDKHDVLRLSVWKAG